MSLTQTPHCHSLFLSTPLSSPSKCLLNKTISHILWIVCRYDIFFYIFYCNPASFLTLYESFSPCVVFFVVNFDICMRSRRRTNLFVIVKFATQTIAVSSESMCGLIEAPDLDVLDLFSHICLIRRERDARGVKTIWVEFLLYLKSV